MPKVSESHRDARRQRILDAAMACFSRDGFHNTTTADIVRESGVSQGSLYLHFATKDDIVVALAHDRQQGEAFLNALAEREQDPIRGLALLIELHGHDLADPGRLGPRRVGVQAWGEALRNPRIRASVVEGLTLVCEALAKLIARGQRTGQIRADIDPVSFARTLIATFQGFVIQAAWDETLDLTACGHVIHGMIGGLLTREGQASWRAFSPLPQALESR